MTLFHAQNIEAILFDLDGTLLEVDMQRYIPRYASALAACLVQQAAVDQATEVIFSAIHTLINRASGQSSNEACFLQHLAKRLGLDVATVAGNSASFFHGDLSALDPLMQPLPLARTLIEQSFMHDLTVVIATNPVFPRAVVAARLARAGLADLDFKLVTSYENCRRCKPNPEYFSDILTHLELDANSCLMVGNDTGHDLAARKVGMPTFLIETWLIDRCRGDFETDLRGDHCALLDCIKTIGNHR